MTREEIKQKVFSVLREQFGIAFAGQSITNATRIVEDLGADSLDLVELTMELEDAFDIRITDEDAEKLTTVGAAIEYIMARKGS